MSAAVDQLPVVVDGAQRAVAALAVLADRLREMAAGCPTCDGSGTIEEHVVAYRVVNVFALPGGPRTRIDRDRGVGCGTLRTPCLSCYRLRQLVEIAEDSL